MHDSVLIPLFVFGTMGFSALLSAIVFLLYLQKKKQSGYQAEKKEREYAFKNELLNAKLEVQEYLLNEVSREIHDNVGQVLSLVKVHLFSVGTQIADNKTASLIETSAELLDKAIEDLRNISHAQSTDIVQQLGLCETIRRELNYVRLKNYTCTLDTAGENYSFPPEQELLIYRVVQEAIHNSIKHAKGTSLNIIIDYQPAVVAITIADNGSGFNTSDECLAKGIGIQHMRYRAKLLNGTLEIKSIIAAGTTVVLKIPHLYEPAG